MELAHAFVERVSLKSGRQKIQVEVDAEVLSPKSVERIRMQKRWVDFFQLFEICTKCFDHIHTPDIILCPYIPCFVSLLKKKSICVYPSILGCAVFCWSVVNLSRSYTLRGSCLCLYWQLTTDSTFSAVTVVFRLSFHLPTRIWSDLRLHRLLVCCYNCCEFLREASLMCPEDIFLLKSSTAPGSYTLSSPSSTTISGPLRDNMVYAVQLTLGISQALILWTLASYIFLY